jgi:zinc protease
MSGAHALDQPAAGGVRLPAHQHLMLPNGIRLILVPREGVPLIACEALVRGGACRDPLQREGVAVLCAELLTHGAGERDAYGFADAVENAGGSLEVEARSEALVLHAQFLSRDRDLMLGLLADALQQPRFENEELAKLRSRRIEFIKAAKDSEPQSLLGSYGRALLFGAAPFGKPLGGSEASLSRIERSDVLRFYREHFGADRLTLVFAGDFDPVPLRSAVSRAFASWRRAEVPLTPLAATQRVQGRRVLLIDAPGATQTYFWIGNVGVARGYHERAALELTNCAFGGSFGSVLMQALRVRSGLTYSVHSGFNRGSVAGEFAISSFTQTESTARAVRITLKCLDELKRRGLDERALGSARNYLLGQYPLGFETAADWAAALGDLDLYGRPESDIEGFAAALERVDTALAARVIQEAYPDRGNLDLVLIGDAARIRNAAQELGPVLEQPLAATEFTPPAG